MEIRRHFATFYVAGFTYYEGMDCFSELQIGTSLSFQPEQDNPYDPCAVAIYYKERKIGFVPKDYNSFISQLLLLGYSQLFEVKVNQIDGTEHPEQQVRVSVKLRTLEEFLLTQSIEKNNLKEMALNPTSNCK